jgi:hydrogenase maturation protease
LETRNVLLIGYGNPGRGDDGLGPAFSEAMAERGLAGLDVDTDYQLVAEHALTVTDYDLVVFADAMMDTDQPFRFERLASARPETLGSHSLRPETVLALADTLYGGAPEAWVLGISGYEFGEVHEGLSDSATANLEAAKAFFLSWYEETIGRPVSAHA